MKKLIWDLTLTQEQLRVHWNCIYAWRAHWLAVSEFVRPNR